MVTKSRFTYLSRDGIHKCQAYKWQNDNVPVKGILQIIHGMQEHMERYDEFASFMCDNGFIVVGNDHLGHGLTVLSEELGYFAKDNADVIVGRDVHRLKKMTEGEYPGLPYFILVLFAVFHSPAMVSKRYFQYCTMWTIRRTLYQFLSHSLSL